MHRLSTTSPIVIVEGQMNLRRAFSCAVLPLTLSLLLATIFLPMSLSAEAVVAISKGDDVDRMVSESVELVGGLRPLIKEGALVVIKPNLVSPGKAKHPGMMTDVRVVRTLIQEIRKVAACRIVVAEGCAPTGNGDTAAAFTFNGYDELKETFGVELLDLNKDKRVKNSLPTGLGYKEYDFPETILICDVLINVPVLKTHNIAGMSVGMKNLFGLLPPPRPKYHARINEVLADISAIRKPDLVVVDGLVGTEGDGPMRGNPIKMDIIIAGRDSVAVDCVAAAVMGYDPRTVRYLELAGQQKIGEADLARITIKGQPIAAVMKKFAYALADEDPFFVPWSPVVVCPWSDELAARLIKLADRAEKYKGWVLTFKPERLKPSSGPSHRESFGFKVYMLDDESWIKFNPVNPAVLPADAAQAREEMKAWIKENLGLVEQPTTMMGLPRQNTVH